MPILMTDDSQILRSELEARYGQDFASNYSLFNMDGTELGSAEEAQAYAYNTGEPIYIMGDNGETTPIALANKAIMEFAFGPDVPIPETKEPPAPAKKPGFFARLASGIKELFTGSPTESVKNYRTYEQNVREYTKQEYTRTFLQMEKAAYEKRQPAMQAGNRQPAPKREATAIRMPVEPKAPKKPGFFARMASGIKELFTGSQTETMQKYNDANTAYLKEYVDYNNNRPDYEKRASQAAARGIWQAINKQNSDIKQAAQRGRAARAARNQQPSKAGDVANAQKKAARKQNAADLKAKQEDRRAARKAESEKNAADRKAKQEARKNEQAAKREKNAADRKAKRAGAKSTNPQKNLAAEQARITQEYDKQYADFQKNLAAEQARITQEYDKKYADFQKNLAAEQERIERNFAKMGADFRKKEAEQSAKIDQRYDKMGADFQKREAEQSAKIDQRYDNMGADFQKREAEKEAEIEAEFQQLMDEDDAEAQKQDDLSFSPVGIQLATTCELAATDKTYPMEDAVRDIVSSAMMIEQKKTDDLDKQEQLGKELQKTDAFKKMMEKKEELRQVVTSNYKDNNFWSCLKIADKMGNMYRNISKELTQAKANKAAAAKRTASRGRSNDKELAQPRVNAMQQRSMR